MLVARVKIFVYENEFVVIMTMYVNRVYGEAMRLIPVLFVQCLFCINLLAAERVEPYPSTGVDLGAG